MHPDLRHNNSRCSAAPTEEWPSTTVLQTLGDKLTGFRDGNSLLLHGLEQSVRVASHLVELVDAAGSLCVRMRRYATFNLVTLVHKDAAEEPGSDVWYTSVPSLCLARGTDAITGHATRC